MTIKRQFAVSIPFAEWEQTGSEGDESSRLLCTGEINRLPLHVEAYAIKDDPEYGQTVADATFEYEWHGICALNPDGGFCTVEINGREYVIVASPFGT